MFHQAEGAKNTFTPGGEEEGASTASRLHPGPTSGTRCYSC